LRICYFGTYDRDYSRNRIIIEGLRQNGVEVVECHRTLWHGTADKIARAAGGWKQLGFLGQMATTYLALARDYARAGPHDAVVVGYAGMLDLYPAWLLSRFSRRPLVLDAYLSVYNSIVNERKLAAPGSAKARLVYALERTACRLADRVLLDTRAHIDYFCELYGLEAARFAWVPIGADDRFFRPANGPVSQAGPVSENWSSLSQETLRAVYHGKYIPTAGVEHILRAAALLAGDPAFAVEFVGEGEGKAEAQALAAGLGLANVTFLGWMEKEELVRHLHGASVCLGNFGDTPQAQRAVSNKVYEGLALGLPVLTGDTAANREVVRHGETAYLCPVADPEAIAAGLRTLKADPGLRARLSATGLTHYRERFTPAAVGSRVREVLEGLVAP
jgi:glycosyltransferase involved in cell wall biosynthesis